VIEILLDLTDEYKNKVYLSMYGWCAHDIMFQLKDFGTHHLIQIKDNELKLETGIGNRIKSIELDINGRLKIVGVDVV
jgi:hypothetical protein